MENDLNAIYKSIVNIVFMLLFFPFDAAIKAFFLTSIWNWYLPDLGITEISFSTTLGLILMAVAIGMLFKKFQDKAGYSIGEILSSSIAKYFALGTVFLYAFLFQMFI